MAKPPEGYHVVRRHIRRNPFARGKKLSGWTIAALVAGVWLLRAARARRLRAQTLARLRLTLAQIDGMDDQAFEFALRDLLIRDGWTARRVGRRGDQAADVIGQDGQRGRIVVQAKHTKGAGKVGSTVMYQVKGTASPVHGAHIAVVVTNGSFTRDAKAWGERHHVYWVDRDRLRNWAEWPSTAPPCRTCCACPSACAPDGRTPGGCAAGGLRGVGLPAGCGAGRGTLCPPEQVYAGGMARVVLSAAAC